MPGSTYPLRKLLDSLFSDEKIMAIYAEYHADLLPLWDGKPFKETR